MTEVRRRGLGRRVSGTAVIHEAVAIGIRRRLTLQGVTKGLTRNGAAPRRRGNGRSTQGRRPTLAKAVAVMCFLSGVRQTFPHEENGVAARAKIRKAVSRISGKERRNEERKEAATS